MIIVRLSGGLGNQMFQYATGRRLALMRAVPLKLDLRGFGVPLPGDTARSFALDVFRINAEFARPEEVAQLCGLSRSGLVNCASKVKEKLLPLKMRHCFKERHFHFDPDLLLLGDRVYLDGFWQSERYFSDIRDTILRDFTAIQPLAGKNLELAEQLATVTSVSIHVRRGDYVTNRAALEYHGVCQLEYYRQGIEYIAEKVGKPRLFIFSDDPEWVRKNLHLPYPSTFVDHNGPDRAYEDLRLMSLCSHNIIANSSFSWWGAWLNRNPGKVVVAPSRWFNRQDINTDDLIPPGWLRI